MSLAETVSGGDRLASLRALRDMLAADLDVCESMRDKAALSLRLVDVLEQIAVIEKAEPAREGTALDEFTRRRAERQTSGSSGSSKRKQRG